MKLRIKLLGSLFGTSALTASILVPTLKTSTVEQTQTTSVNRTVQSKIFSNNGLFVQVIAEGILPSQAGYWQDPYKKREVRIRTGPLNLYDNTLTKVATVWNESPGWVKSYHRSNTHLGVFYAIVRIDSNTQLHQLYYVKAASVFDVHDLE